MGTIIRMARPEEADELTALCMISKQSHGYDADFMSLCADELRVTPEDIKQGEFWVAEQGRLCGCACLHVERGAATGEVKTLFIHPDYQKQGVGRLLWDQILSSAQDSKLEKLHLDSDPFAEPFYQKLGFRTVGQSPSGSIEGRMIPYMEFDLG